MKFMLITASIVLYKTKLEELITVINYFIPRAQKIIPH